MLQKLRQRHSKLCNVHVCEDHLKSLNLMFIWLFDYDWLCIYSTMIYVTCILYIKYIIDIVLHDIKHRHQPVSIIVFQLHWVIQFGSGLLGILPASSLTALKPEPHVMLKWWSPKCCCLRRAYPLELVLNSTAWISWDPRKVNMKQICGPEALGQLATGLASQGLREKGSCWWAFPLLIGISLADSLEGVYEVASIRADASREFQWIVW